jgi:hypothetical protein
MRGRILHKNGHCSPKVEIEKDVRARATRPLKILSTQPDASAIVFFNCRSAGPPRVNGFLKSVFLKQVQNSLDEFNNLCYLSFNKRLKIFRRLRGFKED